MKKFAKISLAAVMTMGLFACTDYVDKYEGDYKANHEYRDAMNLLYGY